MSTLSKFFSTHAFTILLVSAVALASILPASGPFADWFGYATDIAIGALFFLHGARLARDVAIAGLLHWRLHITILSLTFILFPALGLLIGYLPETVLPKPLYMGVLFLCLLPSTVQSSIALVSMAGGNVPAAICSASTSNLLGVLLTPVLAGLFMHVGNTTGSTDSLGAITKIATQLLLPFLLGQLLQPWVGNWIRARKNLLLPIDRGSILMVVYLAFSGAVINGIWNTVSVRDLLMLTLIEFALLLAVLSSSCAIARLLGFKRADEIAIVLCGSKKSLASGVPIANVLFAGQAVGPIVLPVMIFHQMQLMIGAFIAQRYGLKDVDDDIELLEAKPTR